MRWDSAAAQRAIDFFPDLLVLAEGEFAGYPFNLELWQQFIVGSIFGWKGADGFRRFRNSYVEIGKGNGKSPMAGGIGLYMMVADGEPGAQCFAAAVTRDQANILFQDAVKMVQASPELRSRIQQSGSRPVFNLAYLPTGSFFRPISSEGRGLEGKRVHFAAIDEIHEHRTPVVVDKMDEGTKGRRQAHIFEITNSGYDRNSVCWVHHEYSRQVLEGVIPAEKSDTWFAYVCGLDAKDDWRDDKVWIKANPNLGVSVHSRYLREMVDKAAGMPTKESTTKRLNFCIWTQQANPWMPIEVWDACEGAQAKNDQQRIALYQALRESLRGQVCYGGLDLALTRDLSCFVLLFPPAGERKHWAVLAWFWCAEDDIQQRSHRDLVPYDVWARQGFITATPGNVTDHDFIETEIKQLRSQYKIIEAGFDRALAAQLVTHLTAEGLTMVEIAQGPFTMNAPIHTIEKLLLGKQLVHGGHPVMRWCCSNAVLRQDSNGNVKFDKQRATGRIDGMTALATAGVRAFVAGPAATATPRATLL